MVVTHSCANHIKASVLFLAQLKLPVSIALVVTVHNDLENRIFIRRAIGSRTAVEFHTETSFQIAHVRMAAPRKRRLIPVQVQIGRILWIFIIHHPSISILQSV